MARQIGPTPLSGQIGGIIYYKSGSEYLAKGRSSLNKKRVKSDPAFEGSRKASVAFGHATQGAGLLRRAMGPLAMRMAETYMTGKLNGRMIQIVKTDTQHLMDERKLYQGDMGLLKGFSWDSKVSLSAVLKTPYIVAMDRAAGLLEVTVPAFAGKKGLKAPEGATHFELIASGAALDFDKVVATSGFDRSEVMVLGAGNVGPIELSCEVPAGSELPLVLGFGVSFYQEVNGQMHFLRSGGAFEIVGVEVG